MLNPVTSCYKFNTYLKHFDLWMNILILNATFNKSSYEKECAPFN